MSQSRIKSKLLSIFIIVIFVILVGVAFNAQLVHGIDSKQEARLQLISKKYTQPERGIIFDRTGIPFTQNEIRYDLVLSANTPIEEATFIIEDIQNDDVLATYIVHSLPEEIRYEFVLIRGINSGDINDFEPIVSEYDNQLSLVARSSRNYTNPSTVSNIVGYVSSVNSKDLEDDYYQPTDTKGAGGLELVWEDELRGIKRIESVREGVPIVSEGEKGSNIVTTIDSQWQNALYSVIEDYLSNTGSPTGSGVIMDSETGEIYAMASVPSFDSNQFSNGVSLNEFAQLSEDISLPLINKPIGAAYEPGSTFKIISAYSLLQNNIVDANTSIFSNRCMNIGSSPFCEYGQFFYGWVNMERALYKSSNIYFCTHMLTLSNSKGIDTFVNDAHTFQIGLLTGINLPGEVVGNMDSPQYKKDVFNLGWFAGDTCNAAIGQGSIVVTPLQMANAVVTIENGGTYFQPQVVKEIRRSNGTEVILPVIDHVIDLDPETQRLIQLGMTGVAQHPEGNVSTFLKDFPNNIRAKTGSAETFDGTTPKTHGWIIGSFDYQGKRFAFSIFIEYGGGGYYVTPVFQNFMTCLNTQFEGTLCQ